MIYECADEVFIFVCHNLPREIGATRLYRVRRQCTMRNRHLGDRILFCRSTLRASFCDFSPFVSPIVCLLFWVGVAGFFL